MWPTVVTSTLTVTTVTSTICLSLDFAAGPIPQCRRRRRQLWVERPILAPIEEQSWPLLIQPTNTLRYANFNSKYFGQSNSSIVEIPFAQQGWTDCSAGVQERSIQFRIERGSSSPAFLPGGCEWLSTEAAQVQVLIGLSFDAQHLLSQ